MYYTELGLAKHSSNSSNVDVPRRVDSTPKKHVSNMQLKNLFALAAICAMASSAAIPKPGQELKVDHLRSKVTV